MKKRGKKGSFSRGEERIEGERERDYSASGEAERRRRKKRQEEKKKKKVVEGIDSRRVEEWRSWRS